jgi:hypothetical protein
MHNQVANRAPQRLDLHRLAGLQQQRLIEVLRLRRGELKEPALYRRQLHRPGDHLLRRKGGLASRDGAGQRSQGFMLEQQSQR